MREITAYKTSDGKLFEDEKKAFAHQQDIIGELLDHLVADIGGNITRIDRHKTLVATLESKDRDKIIIKLYQAITHNQEDKMENKFYMNIETGSVDTYDGWYYTNEDGKEVNAVDLGEVVEVVKDKDGDWEEA